MAWALATFHASAFVVVIVLIVYSRGALGSALSGLNTLLGLALFVALWGTTVFSTRRALGGLDLGSAAGRALFVRRGFRWGAANGMAFLGILAVVLIASTVLTSPGVLLTVLFAGPFALVIAAAVGALVGFIFGVIDLALLAIATAATDVG